MIASFIRWMDSQDQKSEPFIDLQEVILWIFFDFGNENKKQLVYFSYSTHLFSCLIIWVIYFNCETFPGKKEKGPKPVILAT